MTPEFAAAVDPVFECAIELLDRIQDGKKEETSAAEERNKLRDLLHGADRQLARRTDDWPLAKYALAAWIDEMLIAAPWSGADYFNDNKLQFEVFQEEAAASVGFYQRAAEAAALPKKDALEVLYICVILGFRGLYGSGDAAELAEQYGLPPDLKTWTTQAAKSIQLGKGLPPIGDSQSRFFIQGAPPLEGEFRLLWAALVTFVLAVLTGLAVMWIVVGVGGGG
jgi:type VI secretion system protein ImpK